MGPIRIGTLAVAFLLASAPGAHAAGRVTFGVRYFAEGGSHQTYLVARVGGGLAGEAWLDASEHDDRPVRSLTICHPRAGRARVGALIRVPDGRLLHYRVPGEERCFQRQLGYRISRWQLSFGAELSGQVPPPPLV